MTNKDEIFKRVEQLRKNKQELYEELLRDLAHGQDDLALIQRRYNVEDARLSAEIRALLESLDRGL